MKDSTMNQKEENFLDYETPSLQELFIHNADIVAGKSDDDGPDNDGTADQETGY